MSVPVRTVAGEKAPAVRRVLVYRLGSLGDTLIALPSLHLIERAFPNSERRLLTNIPVSAKAPAAAAVLGESGLIDSYEGYIVGTRSPLSLLLLAWRIHRFRPDVLVYLAAARGMAAAQRDATFFSKACGIGRLIGVPLTEDMQASSVGVNGILEAEASRLARNIAELGDAALDDPQTWDLRLTSTECATANAALAPFADEPFIAMSVGTKVQAKDWGQDNWRALLGRLAALYPRIGLVLVGASEESVASEFAAEGWRALSASGRVVNLCGMLSPRESAAALRRAKVFIGHDSGPMHLAASVGTPAVAIFSARNKPRVWFPYGSQHRVVYHRVDCWGCGLETCTAQGRKCLLSITADEVINAVREVLPLP